MAIRTDFTAGEVLAAADLNDTFAAKANLASPTFTGTPAGPTAASGTNTTQLATTAFVQGASGLVRIATDTFSAVSSVSVNNCFSSAYANYRIVINITAKSADNDCSIRLRASAADNTTSNYSSNTLDSFSTSTSVSTNATQTQWLNIWNAAATDGQFLHVDMFNPFASQQTAIASHSLSTNNLRNRRGGGFFAATTSFDGFSVYPASGTITGTLRVYGHVNS